MGLCILNAQALKRADEPQKRKVSKSHLNKIDQDQYPKRISTHEGLKAQVFSFGEDAHHRKFAIEGSVNAVKNHIHAAYSKEVNKIMSEFNAQYNELNTELNKLAEIHERITTEGASVMENFADLQHTINQKIELLREKGKELHEYMEDVPEKEIDYVIPTRKAERPATPPMYRGRPYGSSPLEYEEIENDD